MPSKYNPALTEIRQKITGYGCPAQLTGQPWPLHHAEIQLQQMIGMISSMLVLSMTFRSALRFTFFLPQDPAANTPDSVGLISVLLASDHQIDQPSVSRHFLLNIAPGIISTARNFKYFEHCLNRIGVAKPLMIRYFSFTFFQLLNSKIRSNSTYIRSFTSSF